MSQLPSQTGSTPSPEPQAPASALSGPVIARAGNTYRRYRYIMFVLMLCFAGWFLYDGFKRWPEDQRRYQEVTRQIEQLSQHADANRIEIADRKEILKKMKNRRDFDIYLQRFLGFTLIPVAIGLLLFWLRRSGGEFRLEGAVLHVPGHPPIPLDNITTLDKTKWDRKGIAFAKYHLADGESGRFRLDDFIYDAHPTREIVRQIEASLLARAAALGGIKTPPQRSA
jgi:hypothetical protein